MARFRQKKQILEGLLLPPAWPEDAPSVPAAVATLTGMAQVAPLLALLPRGGLLMWRAVLALGIVTAGLAAATPEEARTVMRHCMWRLNEDSGNMGWGAAEAMGEVAARSPLLAGEYGRVILSYVRDTGVADNYIDHGPLRRGAYWAVGRFAPLSPAHQAEAVELLLLGLADDDGPCRGVAAWGLGCLARAGSIAGEKERAAVAAGLRQVADGDKEGLATVLEGARLRTETVAAFARQALDGVVGFGSGCGFGG